MRPVTLHMTSARYTNRHYGSPRYRVTVNLWPSQIASMRAYYRHQRTYHAYPDARMLTLAQYAIDWQSSPAGAA